MLRRFLASAVLGVLALPAVAQSFTPDTAGVRAAVLDYLEGFYQGDTTRFVRSIRPDVFKYGYWRRQNSAGYEGGQMTWREMHESANGVREENEPLPANAPREIVLLDVLDQTAAAKLTALWGIDYLLLARENGRWMITHVLWQSPPQRR